VVHSVITGGQALADTLSGFTDVARTTSERSIVVWLNEYFGHIQQNGSPFREMAAYRDNEQKVLGAVGIARRNQDTFGRDVEEMIATKLTFAEALRNGQFSIMAKQRLKIVRDRCFELGRTTKNRCCGAFRNDGEDDSGIVKVGDGAVGCETDHG
jgi:hypothetical protein